MSCSPSVLQLPLCQLLLQLWASDGSTVSLKAQKVKAQPSGEHPGLILVGTGSPRPVVSMATEQHMLGGAGASCPGSHGSDPDPTEPPCCPCWSLLVTASCFSLLFLSFFLLETETCVCTVMMLSAGVLLLPLPHPLLVDPVSRLQGEAECGRKMLQLLRLLVRFHLQSHLHLNKSGL